MLFDLRFHFGTSSFNLALQFAVAICELSLVKEKCNLSVEIPVVNVVIHRAGFFFAKNNNNKISGKD